MAASPGWQTTIKINNTATIANGEACSGATTTWQITSAAKRILDPSVTPTWYDNGTPVLAANIVSVNYLTGTVVFTGSKTGPITVDMQYYPMVSYTGAKSVDVNFSADDLDTSVFGTQWRSHIQGLKTATGKIDNLELLTSDLNPNPDPVILSDIFSAGTQVVLELSPDAGTTFYRFWAILLNADESSAVDALIVTSASFTSVAITAADGTIVDVSLT
jgi:hypothetical protein